MSRAPAGNVSVAVGLPPKAVACSNRSGREKDPHFKLSDAKGKCLSRLSLGRDMPFCKQDSPFF